MYIFQHIALVTETLYTKEECQLTKSNGAIWGNNCKISKWTNELYIMNEQCLINKKCCNMWKHKRKGHNNHNSKS